ALNMAVDDDVLSVNPGLAIDRKAICGEETPREYLTIDEVRKLIEADAPRADVKIAFLFSCFCGLRLSDVRALQWKKIIEDNGNIHMELRQKKTGRMLYLPLNKQAQAYLPHTKRSAEDYVFSLPCTSTIDLQLKKWAQNAGINKKLTYHMSRHTFATMELTMGADLYTTSQLLGHADVETTQVYAKIIDAKKEAAVLLIDSLF
ncbi:site-specific integrase, partial [Bacteroides uniformis]